MTQPLYINREDAKQHLIDEARRAWKAAGTQSLTYADLMTHSDGVTKHAVVHYVGGINELLRLAEIPPHRMHRGRLTEDDVFDAMRKCFIQVGGVTTQAALTRHFDHITFCKDRWHNWHGILLAFSGWLKDSAISFPYYSELESQIARLAPKTTNVCRDRNGRETISNDSESSSVGGYNVKSIARMDNKSEIAKIFIGSSTKGLDVAKIIQLNLEYNQDFQCTPWSQGVFGLSEGTLESLVSQTSNFNSAILVLTPDDMVTKGALNGPQPRDNVLFELGLFMGRLGRDRTFIVCEKNAQMLLPTDLAGVTRAMFQRRVGDDHLQAALGAACTMIEIAIKKLLRNAK